MVFEQVHRRKFSGAIFSYQSNFLLFVSYQPISQPTLNLQTTVTATSSLSNQTKA